MDKLRMKVSALSVDFDDPSLNFLGLREPAHERIKEGTPVKVIILPFLASFVKMVADHQGHAAYYNKHYIVTSILVVLTLMTLKDPELLK